MTNEEALLAETNRSRVRVTDERIEGMYSHHSGKTGVVIETLGVRLTGPNWPARAMVKLDDGSGMAVISIKYLEWADPR